MPPFRGLGKEQHLKMVTLHAARGVIFLCCSAPAATAQQQNATRTPVPSPTPTSQSYLGPGTLSTGYLAVVFGIAFVLVSFTFCTSYCVRIWFLHRPSVAQISEGDRRMSEPHPHTPAPPPVPQGPPPVVVIQPDREISCASFTDPELQQELIRKYTEQTHAVRGSSRFVEIVINQDDNGELSVKHGSLMEPSTPQTPQPAQQPPPQSWLSRTLCFFRPRRRTDRRTDAQTDGRTDAATSGVVEGVVGGNEGRVDGDVEMGRTDRQAPGTVVIGDNVVLGPNVFIQGVQQGPGARGPESGSSGSADRELRVQLSGVSFSEARQDLSSIGHTTDSQTRTDSQGPIAANQVLNYN